MSKAKEKAKEYTEKFILTVDHQSDVEEAYIDGYNQADKDNELTWEDLKALDDISDDVYAECDVEMFDEEEYYQEVLERFKDFREKKEK